MPARQNVPHPFPPLLNLAVPLSLMKGSSPLSRSIVILVTSLALMSRLISRSSLKAVPWRYHIESVILPNVKANLKPWPPVKIRPAREFTCQDYLCSNCHLVLGRTILSTAVSVSVQQTFFMGNLSLRQTHKSKWKLQELQGACSALPECVLPGTTCTLA
jgi:hypothetical protein